VTSPDVTRHNPRITFRPATMDDIESLYGITDISFSVRAFTFLLDGELAGMGGLRYSGGYFVAFCDIKDDIMVSKTTVVRCGLEVMKMIRAMKVPVFAVREDRHKTADRFLRAMGFSWDHTDTSGEVYKWQA